MLMIVPITKLLLLVPESVSRFHNHFPMVYVRPSSILSFPDLQLALPSRDHAMSFDTSSDHSQGLHGRACASMQKRWVCVSFASSLHFPKCGVLAPLSVPDVQCLLGYLRPEGSAYSSVLLTLAPRD